MINIVAALPPKMNIHYKLASTGPGVFTISIKSKVTINIYTYTPICNR